MKIQGRVLFSLCLTFGLLLIFNAKGYAALGDESALDSIIDLYIRNTSAWESSLKNCAISLFAILATLQLAITGVRLLFQGAKEPGEWVNEFVQQGLYLGFFFSLLMFSPDWAKGIIDGFRMAADTANGATGGIVQLQPSEILKIGMNLSGKMIDNPPYLNPAYLGTLVLGAIITLTCFAVMAALIVVALIESYVVISAGAVFMGFGGSKWTSDLALKVLRYAISVGAKLFVLQLLIGLGQRVMLDWLGEFDPNNIKAVIAIIGSSLVFLILTLMVPNIIQGLINGTSFSMSSPGQIAAAATSAAMTAVGVAAGGTGMLAGGASALHGAGALASEQIKTAESEGSGSSSRNERMAQWTANFAGNLKQATIDDVGGRLSGSSRHGYMGGRMGEKMRDAASSLGAEREKAELKRKEAEEKMKREQENTIGGDKGHD